MPFIILTFVFSLLNFSADVQAKPYVYVEHGHNQAGFARSRITNKTTQDLACTMSIDGYKIKYVLTALATSKWYTATEKNYNHTHFSSWCGYLTLYPTFEKYRAR